MSMFTKLFLFVSSAIAIVLLACTQPTPPTNIDNAPTKMAVSAPAPINNAAPQDTVGRNYLMGKIDPTTDKRFAKIAAKYRNAEESYMRIEAYESFQKMYEAALKDGVTLRIISATRPFNKQKAIWEAKWTGKKLVDGAYLKGEPKVPSERALQIMRWSSMPGTSRHHWGTDVDLNELNNPYFDKGTGLKIYTWLKEHASEYGFCQVYSVKGAERPDGYQEERWHWSYTPLSKGFTEEYAGLITDKDISGFIGSESAVEIGAVKKYVLGISKECQ